MTNAATTSDPGATLDAAFPSDGLGGWVIATAVPEPSTVIGLIAAVPFGLRLLRKRRRTASPDTDADTGILKS